MAENFTKLQKYRQKGGPDLVPQMILAPNMWGLRLNLDPIKFAI